MITNKFNSPNASTLEVNINMEYDDDEFNTDENVMEEYNEHNPIKLNRIEPPIINIISSDGTSRSDKNVNKLTPMPRPMQKMSKENYNLSQAGHLTPYPRPRMMIPLSNSKHESYSVAKSVKYTCMTDQSDIELPLLHQRSSINNQDLVTAIHQPLQKQHSPSNASATSNQNDSISYRTALDVTPSSDYITIGDDCSPSQIINNIWSRVRHPFTRHAMLEISSPIRSSPERSSHRKSCPSHCVIGWSLIATGTIVLISSIICLALIDNTVPDHENGIHYPIYEALYALRGQTRPINSYDLNIEDVNVDMIPVHPHGIKDYSETHHLSKHGPYTIFDNDHSTFWNPVNQMQSTHMSHPPGYSITVDLLHNYTMTAVRIRDFGNYDHDVTDCQLEVNKDGVWRLVFRHSSLPPGHKIKEVNGFAVWGSLWKFTVLGTASGKQPWIKEIQFFGFKG